MIARRALLWFVALMPVVWGNCPYWFVGYPPSHDPVARGEAPAPVCPCCRAKKTPKGAPVAPNPCGDDCPMTIARRGATPVGASVPAPASQAFVLLAAVPVASVAPLASLSAPEPVRIVRPPGPPLDHLETVVLLI